MTDRTPDASTDQPPREEPRDTETDRPVPRTDGIEDSPGMPGGTLGTGGAREQDQ